MEKFLGLYNKLINNPYAYCALKKCFLTELDFEKKQCQEKACVHIKLLDDVPDIRSLETKPYKEEEYFKYCFSNESQIKMQEAYDNGQNKKNYSSVPALKQKAKEKPKHKWQDNLNVYYKQKYGIGDDYEIQVRGCSKLLK